MTKAKAEKQKPIRVTAPFDEAIGRTLQAPPISDADLLKWVERQRKKRKTSKRQRAHQ